MHSFNLESFLTAFACQKDVHVKKTLQNFGLTVQCLDPGLLIWRKASSTEPESLLEPWQWRSSRWHKFDCSRKIKQDASPKVLEAQACDKGSACWSASHLFVSLLPLLPGNCNTGLYRQNNNRDSITHQTVDQWNSYLTPIFRCKCCQIFAWHIADEISHKRTGLETIPWPSSSGHGLWAFASVVMKLSHTIEDLPTFYILKCLQKKAVGAKSMDLSLDIFRIRPSLLIQQWGWTDH